MRYRVSADSTNRNRRFDLGVLVKHVDVSRRGGFIYAGARLRFDDGKLGTFPLYELEECYTHDTTTGRN